MIVIFGIFVFVAWVLAIELCIESRRAKNIGLITLLLCSFWLMQAAIKRLDCGGIVTPDRPDVGVILPW